MVEQKVPKLAASIDQKTDASMAETMASIMAARKVHRMVATTVDKKAVVRVASKDATSAAHWGSPKVVLMADWLAGLQDARTIASRAWAVTMVAHSAGLTARRTDKPTVSLMARRRAREKGPDFAPELGATTAAAALVQT